MILRLIICCESYMIFENFAKIVLPVIELFVVLIVQIYQFRILSENQSLLVYDNNSGFIFCTYPILYLDWKTRRVFIEFSNILKKVFWLLPLFCLSIIYPLPPPFPFLGSSITLRCTILTPPLDLPNLT